MKEKFVIAAVLVVTASIGIVSLTRAYADFTCTHAVCAATDSNPPVHHDKSDPKIKITSKQSIVASGETVSVQNCAENNVNSQVTSGDEGVDCHNNQFESEIQQQENETGID